jgi:hypothetical protein
VTHLNPRFSIMLRWLTLNAYLDRPCAAQLHRRQRRS